MGAVISFFRPASTSQGGWSQQELAEFYRVEAALIRAGLQIGSEQGLSDEAEPWFVFCRPDGDAIMHFARIDGSYVIASEVLDSPMRGSDFRALINQVAQRYPGLLPIPQGADGTKLSVHPAALLAALVAAAALSLSSRDAFAAEPERSGDERGPAGQSGHGQHPEAAGAGDADERDSHRKQFGVIVFSAMIFAADVAAADSVEWGTEPGLIFGSQGSSSVAAWEQDGAPLPAGEVVRPVAASVPLASGARDHAPTGTSGVTTAEATAAVLPPVGSADVRAVGPGHPTSMHGTVQPSLENAYQDPTQTAEVGTIRTAGSSSSPEARSDAGAAASADAEGAGQAGPSPAATGEAVSQTPSATLGAGHSPAEMPSGQLDGVATPAPFDLSRSASPPRDDGPEGREHAARHGLVSHGDAAQSVSKVAEADHAGTSALDHIRSGAVGHGAAIGPDAGQLLGALKLSASGSEPGHAQAGASPGRSAEAPGQLKDIGQAPHGADDRGAAVGAEVDQLPGASQGSASGADRGHIRSGAEAHGANHVDRAAAVDSGSHVDAGRSPDLPRSGTPAPLAVDQPSLVGQTSQAGGQSQGPTRAAHVDLAGNIVFSSDARSGHAATPSHSPVDAGTHGEIGLIGLSDHGPNAHHIDYHS